MAITINGSGTVTGITAGGLPDNCITADDLATTLDLSSNTITLPSGTGGKVLQVVSTTKTDTFTTTSTSFTDITGLSVSITPSSTSSKIMVSYNVTQGGYQYGAWVVRLMRDSTAIAVADDIPNGAEGTTAWAGDSSRDGSLGVSGMNYLDSPSTTSAITYKLQLICSNSGTANINKAFYENSGGTNVGRGVSSITVMEIGA